MPNKPHTPCLSWRKVFSSGWGGDGFKDLELMKSRIFFVCFVLALAGGGLVLKGAWLQFFPDERLTEAKKRNFEKLIRLKPRRGMIYDRKGRELALSVSSESLFADPSLIRQPRALSLKLARILRMPSSKIHQKIKNKNRRFVWLKRHLSEKESQLVRKLKNPGLSFFEEPKRVYPNGSVLAGTLGFVGRDGQGLEGLELHYDKVLRGKERKVLVQKDAKGKPLFSDVVTDLMTFRTNGADIYLTIDLRLQFFLEKELKKTVQLYSAKSALALIMDPGTGEVLAVAQVPSFDLNKPFGSDPRLFRNRSFVDAFEPGSTFKPFIALSALKEGLKPTTRYDGQEGRLLVEGHVIQEAESDHQFEDLDIQGIISRSSNIGAAQIALQMGENKLYRHLKNFGFGSRLGIDFPGESKGILNPPPWTPLQLATTGFGHSIAVTALQLTAAYSAIANRGVLKKPFLVRSIHYKESGGKEVFHPQTLKSLFTPQEADAMTVMLMSALSEKGTGPKARVKGFLAAGKTGTAQMVDLKKGGYREGAYISSFAGFIPAHQPRFVIYVAVQGPKKKFYGSTVAAPVFSRVAEYAVRRAGLSPTLISEENLLKPPPRGTGSQTRTPASARVLSQSTKATEQASGLPSHTPDLTGLSLREAFRLARRNHIILQVAGFGRVSRTQPSSGEKLPENRTVKAWMNHPLPP